MYTSVAFHKIELLDGEVTAVVVSSALEFGVDF